MIHRLRSCSVLLVVVAVAIATPAGADPGEELHALFAEYDAWLVREYPEDAVRRGNLEFADRLADRSPEAAARRSKERRAFRARLDRIQPRQLDEIDRESHEIFGLILDWELGDDQFHAYQMPITQISGPQVELPRMADGIRLQTASDFNLYLDRVKAVSGWVDQMIAAMRQGMTDGRTPPRAAVAGVRADLERLLTPDGLDMLRAPLKRLPSRMRDAQRETLSRRFHFESLPAVRSALRKLLVFWTEEYEPACRTTIAATDLPDGAAAYAHQLWRATSTRMTAEAIHDTGREQVTRIREAMIPVLRRTDFLRRHTEFEGADDEILLRVFREYLRDDDRFRHPDGPALLARYRELCKRVDGRLPAFFDLLPRLPYGVREVPEALELQSLRVAYRPGSFARLEPGYLDVNTQVLHEHPTYEMAAIVLHEAMPGHHLRRALADELKGLPEFRRYLELPAHTDGWALYAESLGVEMEMYDDPYDEFGRLQREMWQACRLVVDTGIHAMGWSREDASRFLREHTVASDESIGNEIDAIVARPAEACAAKVGELEIKRLRAEASRRLGRSFDLRTFHRIVLESGSLPLSLLEDRVDAWIRSQPGGLTYD